MSDESAGQMSMILAALQSLQVEFRSLRTEFQDLRAELKGDIAELRAELKGDIAELRTELKGDIAELRVSTMARMDRLQDGLTSIRDDIAVDVGSADAIRRANDNTREEVRTLNDTVAVMWRQLKRLEGQVRELGGGG